MQRVMNILRTLPDWIILHQVRKRLAEFQLEELQLNLDTTQTEIHEKPTAH